MGCCTLPAMLGVVRTTVRSRFCRPQPCDLGLIGGSPGLICEMGVPTLPPGGGHCRQGHRWQPGAPSPQPPGWGEAWLCFPSDFWASLWLSLKPPEQGAGGAGRLVSLGEKRLPQVPGLPPSESPQCSASPVLPGWGWGAWSEAPGGPCNQPSLFVCLPPGCPRARQV